MQTIFHFDSIFLNVRTLFLTRISTYAFSGHTVTIIVMVCAGFLLLMISLGVVRIRASRRRAQQDETTADTEMAWDDSALTITVNPMEVQSHISPLSSFYFIVFIFSPYRQWMQ